MNLVFDIDGTICFDGQHIDEEITQRLTSLHNVGHRIIFASARPIRDLLPVLPKPFHKFPLIGGNGSIASENKTIRTLATISHTDFQIIKDIINKYDLNYIVDDKWDYAANVSTTNEIYKRLDPLHLAQKRSVDDISSPIKVIMLNIPTQHFEDIASHLSVKAPHLSLINHSNELNIDITAQHINKYTAIEYILGSTPVYVAFGNDHNDITMLQNAEAGYFVNNKTFNLTDLENHNNINMIEADVASICTILDQIIYNTITKVQ
ncbi:HAD family hydrolase [Staphylococcus sp. NRL 16/872]|uniref:HAD-IIB family hydrolase n=1 Tax=Staphylococcus sp. NRL 16/872 TaxID=2930131 RepID=UPI001FB28BA7|nr:MULTISPECIES: HAD family hydrolase [unclassified Staphylococcus]MCJ1656402.1 Cof-type HAD-IIB family hydrolase [Staphylococcus sp. NRL 21/187]MCJ1662167.1 Cof-type HAD-IIB family hydrolase [Staphylococcus sp. NRL 18/288]MCJ1668237.1 Cof-type HAD-IIB family hydrolase [Staphylococcus sp. NRL 19/737]WEN68435.1 HAD family hydrolase [Staphylococcus sp. NRL 16/872]